MTPNRAASVRARLLNLAKAQASDFNEILIRFALERLLYRLSRSTHSDRFLLKGAMLFALWYEMPHRATRDVDLLGFGPSDLDSIALAFREIAAVVADDGITFDPNSIRVGEIRKAAGYAGARVQLRGELSGARCSAQVDIGFGDAVTPGPVPADFPVLLDDLPAPSLRTYPVYTVVAEKLHAVVLLGMQNSRLKDYFDLSIIMERETALSLDTLGEAIVATFERRQTPLPDYLPVGLTDEFAADPTRQTIWATFLRKNLLTPEPLKTVTDRLGTILGPALARAREISHRQRVKDAARRTLETYDELFKKLSCRAHRSRAVSAPAARSDASPVFQKPRDNWDELAMNPRSPRRP